LRSQGLSYPKIAQRLGLTTRQVEHVMIRHRERHLDTVRRQLGQVKDLAYGPQDPEVRARVLALHGQGHGPCHIARAAGISRKQVARLLAGEGILREPSRPASSRLPEILELRRQGCGFAVIGRRLGFSHNAVRRAFRNRDRADLTSGPAGVLLATPAEASGPSPRGASRSTWYRSTPRSGPRSARRGPASSCHRMS
jgi:hypothetical protein